MHPVKIDKSSRPWFTMVYHGYHACSDHW